MARPERPRSSLAALALRHFLPCALALAALASAHAFLYLPLVTPHETQDTSFYVADAEALLDGHYSTPLGKGDLTGLRFPRSVWHVEQRETFRAPGYPAFLALLGGGGAGASRDAVLVVQALLVGAGAFLVALFSRRLFGPGIALAGTALYALDPYSKRYASLVLAEVLSAVLLFLAIYGFVRAWQARSWRWWSFTGLTLGALILVRPVFTLALPLFLGAALFQRLSGRERLRHALAYGLCAAILIAPWLVRNTFVVGRPVLQSFGVGWGLLAGAYGEGLERTNREIVESEPYRRDFYSVQRFAPPPARYLVDPNAHARYLYRADSDQRTRARHIFARRLEHEPWTVAWEWLYRSYFLWMAHEDWYQPGGAALLLLRLVDWIALALAAVGAVIAFRRFGGPARVLVGLLVLYTASSAVGHVEARYTVPLRGISLPLAALALAALAARKAQIHTAAVERLPTASR